MAKGRGEIDMLHGPLGGKLLRFALPLAAGSMVQQLFNAADTAVVGRFGDADALAAVGTNGEVVALLVSLSLGLAMGANVLLAGLIGRGDTSSAPRAVHTALGLAILVGAAGLLLGQWIARPLLVLLQTPASALEEAVLYLRIYFLGYPALLLYDFGAAILRARGDSRRPFQILLLAGGVNVGANLFLVAVCGLGVAGVAIATDAATLLSAVLVLRLLLREEEAFRFVPRALRLHRAPLAHMLALGVPAALQGAVFCFANLFVQAAVNGFGADMTAGSAIAMNFEYFGYYMITAYGQAATTFTGQNDGAGDFGRCRAVLRHCLLGAVIGSAAITVPLTVFRTAAAGLFSADAAVVAAAGVRISLILAFEPLCGCYEVCAGFLRGLGHSAVGAVITIVGTCLLRIAWVALVFPLRPTPQTLFAVFPLSWVVTSVLMAAACGIVLHKRMKWKRDVRLLSTEEK